MGQIQIVSLQMLSTAGAKMKSSLNQGGPAGLLVLLLIIWSFHLYPCRFAPIHTVNVMHTIWRRLLQRFMTLWCCGVWCSSVPGNLHHFTTDETTWMSVKTNIFFSQTNLVTICVFWPIKCSQYFAMFIHFSPFYFVYGTLQGKQIRVKL